MIDFLTEEEREAMETGDPVVIELDEHLVAWVSPEDEDIANWGWRKHATKKGGTPQYYAACTQIVNGIPKIIWLHQLIWERMTGDPIHSGYLVDHWNQDKLDNRRCNLRAATRTENEANKQKRRTHKKRDGTTAPHSKYKGVSIMSDKHRNKPWRCTISKMENGKTKSKVVGYFATEREAAECYNKHALEYFGHFAYLNKFEEDDHVVSGDAERDCGGEP